MGLKPKEVKALTIREFNQMLTGMFRRDEKQWNHTRHLMAYVLNYGGMGTRKFYTPQQVLGLGMDKEETIKPITTTLQAMELFNRF